MIVDRIESIGLEIYKNICYHVYKSGYTECPLYMILDTSYHTKPTTDEIVDILDVFVQNKYLISSKRKVKNGKVIQFFRPTTLGRKRFVKRCKYHHIYPKIVKMVEKSPPMFIPLDHSSCVCERPRKYRPLIFTKGKIIPLNERK